MLKIQAFRYRLAPNVKQLILFAQSAGSCRYIYNIGLSYCMDMYELAKQPVSYADLCRFLTFLKKSPDKIWLRSCYSQILQQSLKDLTTAFNNFFNGNGFPRFKKKGKKDSFRFPQGVEVRDGKVYLPKIGWVNYFDSRPLEGKICFATVKRESKHWFISIVCEMSVVIELPVIEEKAVGIDGGLDHLATLSTGHVIDNPRFFRELEKKLAKQCRRLSRKVEGSNNYKKQAQKVADVHRDIKNARKDYLHKHSTAIVKNHDVIAVESLNVQGMGRNSRMSKSIYDASWGMFYSMLEYKAAWYGKHMVKIDRFFPSSQLCSSCGSKQKMPLEVRFYKCNCGLKMDRDLNASINIRAAGLAVLNACGGIGAGQPSEARIA